MNHESQIEFINNVDQQYKFMDANELDRIITNDEDQGVMFLLVPKNG